jgi:glyoxylase-like metal-dependent hydrolase (beta-lactamase superfamily II)
MDEAGATAEQGGLVQGWFRVSEPEPGVFAIEEPLHDERVASYLIVGDERALLVDAGMGVGDLRAVVASLTDRSVTLLVSHAHFDHVGGAWRFAADGPVLVHPLEADRLRAGTDNAKLRRFMTPEHLLGPLPSGYDLETAAIPGVEPTGFVADGDRIDLGGRVLEVIHAPGHEVGLLALRDRANRLLFSTDVVYAGAIYAHMPGSDLDAYRATMTRLAALAPEIDRIYPAHNERPLAADVLPRIAAALDAAAAGRDADAVDGAAAVHRFDGFSVLVRAGSPA